MLVVLLVLIASYANAQYPDLLYDSTVTIGQCLTDSDCAIYNLINASLVSLGIFCDPATTRCTMPWGEVLDPAFAATCPFLTMSHTSFPSFAKYSDIGNPKAYLADGMIIVRLAFTTFNYVGVLRLYRETASLLSDIQLNNVNVPPYAEQFVNVPTTTFTFRGLFSTSDGGPYTAYRLVYFDRSGCTAYYGPVIPIDCIRADCLTPSYFGASMPIQAPLPCADLLLPQIIEESTLGRFHQSYSADSTRWSFPSTPGAGVRCLVGQIFDMTGRVITSKVNTQMWNSGITPALVFPLGDITTTAQALNVYRLAGYVKLQLGIGFCVYANASQSSISIIQDTVGIYEMARGQSTIFDLSDNVTTPVFDPVYENATRYYIRLNLVQLNTYLIKKGGPPDPFGPAFGNYVDMSQHPIIKVLSNSTQQQSLYSYCTQSGIIYYNYDGFNLTQVGGGGTFDLYLKIIDINDPNLGELTVAVQPAMLLPGTFTVTSYGFYCLELFANFIDSLGKRMVLRSCFQVGRLSATVTQLSSYFTNALPTNPYPSFVYAGYGSYVTTNLYLNLPPFIITYTDYFPRIQIYRFSPNVFDNAQLELYEGVDIDVYENSIGLLDIDYLYDPLISNANTVVHAFDNDKCNVYTKTSIAYNGAAEVSTEVTYVNFESINPGELVSDLNDTRIPDYVDYQCQTSAILDLISEPRMISNITYETPICPADLSTVTGFVCCGFCMPVISPDLNSVQNNAPPFKSPCTYYLKYYNVEDPNNALPLYGTQEGILYEAPPNVPLMFEAIDIMGNVVRTFFEIVSSQAENSTIISFLPPLPVCGVNGTQMVRYEFVLSGIVDATINNGTANITIPAIYGWEPLNVLALAQYNPNTLFFDLPSDCALLLTMSPFDVFQLCYNQSVILLPICTGCTKLPIVYEGVNNTQITTSVPGYWNAWVWRASTVFNEESGRYWYCRFELSVYLDVPDSMSFTATNLRRLFINGNQCTGFNCFAMDFTINVDPNFVVPYLPMVQMTAVPQFNSLVNATAVSPPALNANSRGVSSGVEYVITLSLDSVFCPVTAVFIPSISGPLIQVARTTHSVCTSASGTVTFYMVYHNTTLPSGSGYSADVCMFWPGYETSFYLFGVPINSDSTTALPFSPDFFVSENITRFNNVPQGTNTVVVYDACPGAINCVNPNCAANINQNSLQVTPGLNFQVFQFTVDQFGAPGAGMVVSLDNRTNARCYGDKYILKFSVYDDLGEENDVYGPYEWQFFEPRTIEVLEASLPCVYSTNQLTQVTTITGGAALFNPLVTINFKVYLFNAEVEIPTGTAYGFRESGNYSLVVRNCKLGCTRTYDVWVNMVNPFDVQLNPIASTCAYTNGALIRFFSGGTPFIAGTLFDQTYYPALPEDDNFTLYGDYITYWKTPFNPFTFVRVRLQTQLPPGNYTVMLEDANGCSVNVSTYIDSPPPIIVSVDGVDAACQSSSTATVRFVVKGGIGPPYFVLSNLTTLAIGQNVSVEFVSSFGQTQCFYVMDSVGCINPVQVCFNIPTPGPVPINITSTDSCPTVASGTATATTNSSGYSCVWQSPQATFPAAQTCTITNVPAGATLQVTLTNIIGCVGVTQIVMGQRPLIVVTQLVRTVNGQYGQLPCIDTAVLSIYGGLYSPNYTLSLVQDPTNANLTYDYNHTITIYGVCRSVQYVIAVRDGDGSCLQTFFSNDPQFGFGSTTNVTFPYGLPPFANTEFGAFFGSQTTPVVVPPKRRQDIYHHYPIFFIVFGVLFGFGICMILLVSIKRTRATTQRVKNKTHNY